MYILNSKPKERENKRGKKRGKDEYEVEEKRGKTTGNLCERDFQKLTGFQINFDVVSQLCSL